MGYTHYWYRPKTIPAPAYARVVSDFKRLIPWLLECGAPLAGGLGEGEAQLDDNQVLFNGVGEDSYETFHFPRQLEPERWQAPKHGRYFEFCKTARHAYDLAVTCFLIVAKHHLGQHLIVRSDGETEEWQDARNLCQRALGYGADFCLDREDEEAA